MKIITYNVRNWLRDPCSWKLRAERIRKTIEAESPDVIFLQEALPPMTRRCVPDGYRCATPLSISHHIYVRRDYAELEGAGWHLRWCRARIRTQNAARFNLVCVHTRWEEKIYKRTCQQIRDLKSHGATLIAGGDWNNEPATIRPEVWPLMLKNAPGITFAKWGGEGAGNLDYFVGDNLGGATVRKAQAGDFFDSDHLPVVIELL